MEIINLVMSQNEDARKNRKQRKADNEMWMKALSSMTKCVVAAITNNPTALQEESNSHNNSDSNSDSESLSSYCSNDTPPTKRKKIRAGKTKKTAEI